jgi:hypothetical protein
MNRWLLSSIIICSSSFMFNFVFSQAMGTSNQPCFYPLLGNSIAGSSCPLTGTPTVISDAFGHVDSTNEYLDMDKEQYYNYMVSGEPHQWIGWWTVLSPQELAQICSYDKNGNFWHPLTDSQKRVLLDMQGNYSVFVCPFTGTPTPTIPTASGLKGPITSTTINVMNLTGYSSQTQSNTSSVVPNQRTNQSVDNMTQNSNEVKDLVGISQITRPNATMLHNMNMSGAHIPSWFKKITGWAIDGQISQNDFVNALKFLSEKGIIK